ncbi:DNA-protecting protein DprA [Acidithiobacillus caldus]|uniref:Rossmann fold nucleotide-binding protein Smf possibly involved in DNA uptake n=2 Tax=Acidithiobacillus caldus TaxID=33059 RepID=F9ZT57_ACICS|nr:DNA-processing protein DprA [Acidithiobacillus caldus]AEK56663.1 Rossmann fold nucleotide-binding protein Smf possibly involved in DNA uptake [Acidithiobacillus caldus SM-1]AUW31587.1 DNA-protecting protein DprA [Acidithiobacillus caldus]OFC28982.1 DNA protecting protein DprA [Acidithiobacillus caldus]OFC37159.1 DNA protecting protein DprA [Acidithiobacillus caldus]OFC38163.1 DNA protecting protein DprA [Acidithiobacillus caldus]
MSRELWLALGRIPGLGPVRQRALLQHFGSVAACFGRGTAELAELGLGRAQVAQLQKDPGDLLNADDRRWLAIGDNAICSLEDSDYPALLRILPDAPAYLHLRGRRELLGRAALAIVGTRHPTPSGRANAVAFAESLGRAGLVIVSGLALGIDGAAHEGALETGTVAVLATGPDIVYPREHLELAHRILDAGLLVSEQAPGTGPRSGLFPRRNRLISGLSLGVLVVEAALQSGSLITARLALDQGREVFAIPGSIHSPLARGPHALIRAGAKLVETSNDILEELGPLFHARRELQRDAVAAKAPEDPQERMVWNALHEDTLSLEEISERSGLTLSALSAILLNMEIHGFIAPCPGGRFCRLSGFR